jgi:PAS domain S-box-containing protein
MGSRTGGSCLVVRHLHAVPELSVARVRRQVAERDELFQLITENAADMIAFVDNSGRRLYNSPAYQKVLGYSVEELSHNSSFDQIRPSDRERVVQAAKKAHRTGRGQRLEYRMRHKDGTWRILESTANPIQNGRGEIEKLVIVNRDITEQNERRRRSPTTRSTIV